MFFLALLSFSHHHPLSLTIMESSSPLLKRFVPSCAARARDSFLFANLDYFLGRVEKENVRERERKRKRGRKKKRKKEGRKRERRKLGQKQRRIEEIKRSCFRCAALIRLRLANYYFKQHAKERQKKILFFTKEKKIPPLSHTHKREKKHRFLWHNERKINIFFFSFQRWRWPHRLLRRFGRNDEANFLPLRRGCVLLFETHSQTKKPFGSNGGAVRVHSRCNQ